MSSFKKGGIFVLSSPSGAGKTTLVKKIAKNSSDFAKQNLATEDAYVYLYLCLMKYHSLFAKK